jgi:O-antigen/teichoic acid export membrane protein
MLSGFVGFGGNFLTSELAKNHNDKILISFYQIFIILGWILTGIILIIAFGLNKLTYLFPEISNNGFIFLAFLLAYITYMTQMYESIADATGLTKSASKINLISKVAGVILLIVFIYLINWINLYSIIFISIIMSLITAFFFAYVLRSNNIDVKLFKISWVDFKNKFKHFFSYSHPLLTLSIVTFSFGLFARWSLQFFGGSAEQGYFSFSDSFSGFIIIFGNSITPLLQREFSISFNASDNERMKSIFERSLLIFISFTSLLSIFILYNTKTITNLIGGNSYDSSILSTQIMLFYPIPYIANNILYSTCYATNKTKLLRNVQIFIVLLNTIITFVLIAPEKYWGFNLGAIGFALSLVAVTYLNHIILLIYCSKMFDLNWFNLIFKYLRIIGAFMIIGLFCFYLDKVLTFNPIYILILNGFLYFSVSILLMFYLPSLVGFSSININEYIKIVKLKCSNIFKTI